MSETEKLHLFEKLGEEFKQKMINGDVLDVDQFTNSHPEYGGALRDFLEALEFVHHVKPKPSDSNPHSN